MPRIVRDTMQKNPINGEAHEFGVYRHDRRPPEPEAEAEHGVLKALRRKNA